MKNMYNRIYLILALCLGSTTMFATNHLVEVEDFEFNPQFFSANVGDTVTWIWHDGTHSTTSNTIPAGASSWDHEISSVSTIFQYVITHPGTYSYFCTPHQSMGMTGAFQATGTTSVFENSKPELRFTAFQSSDRSIHLKFETSHTSDVVFRIMDISGKVVFTSTSFRMIKGEMIRFDPTISNEGIYLVELSSSDLKEIRRMILH